jgi:hypothetical protein
MLVGNQRECDAAPRNASAISGQFPIHSRVWTKTDVAARETDGVDWLSETAYQSGVSALLAVL